MCCIAWVVVSSPDWAAWADVKPQSRPRSTTLRCAAESNAAPSGSGWLGHVGRLPLLYGSDISLAGPCGPTVTTAGRAVSALGGSTAVLHRLGRRLFARLGRVSRCQAAVVASIYDSALRH